MLDFWEKIVRIEKEYARDIEELCQSRYAHLLRMFSTQSVEPIGFVRFVLLLTWKGSERCVEENCWWLHAACIASTRGWCSTCPVLHCPDPSLTFRWLKLFTRRFAPHFIISSMLMFPSRLVRPASTITTKSSSVVIAKKVIKDLKQERQRLQSVCSVAAKLANNVPYHCANFEEEKRFAKLSRDSSVRFASVRWFIFSSLTTGICRWGFTFQTNVNAKHLQDFRTISHQQRNKQRSKPPRYVVTLLWKPNRCRPRSGWRHCSV